MAKETKAIFVHDKLMSMESLFVVAAAINSMKKKDQLQTSGLLVFGFFSVSCSTFRISAVCGLTDTRSGCSDFKGSR